MASRHNLGMRKEAPTQRPLRHRSEKNAHGWGIARYDGLACQVFSNLFNQAGNFLRKFFRVPVDSIDPFVKNTRFFKPVEQVFEIFHDGADLSRKGVSIKPQWMDCLTPLLMPLGKFHFNVFDPGGCL